MSSTAEMVARLRRMVNEAVGNTTYSDDDLEQTIEAYPLIDAVGEVPFLEDGTSNPDWTATYDLSAAAADIWGEKAGALAGNYDFSTQGQSFHRSQAFAAAMQAARYYRSRRAAGTIRQVAHPAVEIEEDD